MINKKVKGITDLGVWFMKNRDAACNTVVFEVGKKYISKDELKVLAKNEFIEHLDIVKEISSIPSELIMTSMDSAGLMALQRIYNNSEFISKAYYNSSTRDIIVCYQELVKDSFKIDHLIEIEGFTKNICKTDNLSLRVKNELSDYTIDSITNFKKKDFSLIHLRRVVPCEIIQINK